MTNYITNTFINNTGLNKQNSLCHLLNTISPESENEIDLIEQSKYYSNDEYNVLNQQTSTDINILNLNCYSLNARIDELKLFLASVNVHSQFSCITLQETWCDETSDMSQFEISGYNMVIKYKSAQISDRGGLIIYVHEDFYYNEIPGNHSLIHESLGIEVWRKHSKYNNKFVVFSIYRVPTGLVEDLMTFIDKFSEILETYQNRKTYVCCDTNINLLDIDSKPHFNTFYENIVQLGYLPKITLPTRLGANTLIDNIFTNNVERSHISGIFQYKLSDHQATFCMLKGSFYKKNATKYIEIEKINDKTMNSLTNDLMSQDIYSKLDTNLKSEPNTNCKILLETIIHAKSIHMPRKRVKFNKRKHKREKWMTDELLHMVNKKNKMYVDWKANSLTEEIYNIKKIHFRAYERIFKERKNEIKREYYYKTFNEVKSSMKKTWRKINETLSRHKKQTEFPTSFLHNGRTLSDPTDIANTFNDFFVNIGSNLASNIDLTNINGTFQQYLHNPTAQACVLKNVTEVEVLAIIDKMDNKCSTGVYELSNKILKCIKHAISKSLTLIINQMIETGVFPKVLKTSKTIPLYKKGDAKLLSNYRPISLLPTLSKVFERIIYNQLYNYFNTNDLLSVDQFGFRAHHSTELAAIKLADYINHQMDKCKIPVNIYLDLSKAFDTLDFDILLHKLNYYGVTGKVNNLIGHYLKDRRQCVNYGNTTSNEATIKTGVPQGSILGPLLFSIYINDLTKASDIFNFILYADDTTLYFNLDDFPPGQAELSICHELEKINAWLKLNRLSLNAEKTKLMIFHTRQRIVDPIQISINNVPIEIVNSFNFLGIHFDNNLSWKSHTKMLTNKLSKIVGILNRLKGTFPQHTLLTIYNSLFLSHVNYGMLLWGTKLEKITLMQKKAIRIISQANYTEHTEPLMKTLGLLKICDIFNLKLLKFVYNLSYELLPSYFNIYLEYLQNGRDTSYNLRTKVRPLHKMPKIAHAFAESSLLYQMIHLLNDIHNRYPQILAKIEHKTHSYNGFCFNVKSIFLDTYSMECSLAVCYQCSRS